MPRTLLLGLSFLGLALYLLITSCILLSPLREDFYKLSTLRVSLDIVCQIVLNIVYTGINPLIFIIPSEIFPIRYRGTCYGITAAFGAFGLAVGEVFWPSINVVGSDTSQLGVQLLFLSILFGLVSVLVLKWLPELQGRQSMKKKL
ncbi:hypothetical protein NA56DRAFT_665959 [Hyaloscypha hepaticicola]|uniref:Major facilitator superfamily (MFS) profile domain-containing protein n=1 Tax=Hyaloscypha hepaticicola TaxID=2082293 RepID=A0A2J6PFX0_9HELO|nr:hypothetical protein NA56DRAFT_665959 [Hyaloscypha hepaticicola]